MTRDRFPCQAVPTVRKFADVLHKSEVTDPTEAETLEDVWKLSLLVTARIAAALARTNLQ
jgi:hypothetical protein